MRPHEFHPDRENCGICELCGEGADAPIHENDFEPPDDDRGDDYPRDYPRTVAALFDSYGIKQP